MRNIIIALGVLIGTSLAGGAQEQPAPAPKAVLKTRFGYDANLGLYPQKTPQEAVKSAVKAIFDQRFEYLLAHLADPAYVDARVDKYVQDLPGKSETAKAQTAFKQLVKQTTDLYFQDPERIAELRQFGKEAEWAIDEDRAVGTLKNMPRRQLFLRRLEDRWFLENRQQKQ